VIDITTIGWLTIDDVVLTDGTCRQKSRGGGALYSAVGAQMWNPRVGIHSVAGKPYFDETKAQIEARGIDASGISRSEGNGLELWLLHESEVHKQQVPKLSSSDALGLDAERGPVSGLQARAKGFHLAPQGPESSIANARQLAAFEPRPVVTMDILADDFIDASVYRDLAFLEYLTAFMPSEAEIVRIWRPSTIEAWLKENAIRYGCHMVAKLGERGSLICEASTGTLTHVPAFPAQVVDTTGAGDGFCGGFIAGLVAGEPLVVCATMGTVSASYVVEAYGALETHLPTADERAVRLVRVRDGVRALSYQG
jgi:sugar/nucleoside kinase (ribokinase family)